VWSHTISNSDADPVALKTVLQEQKLTWRNLWDGPLHEGGRISPYWNVRSWPTLYLIDHRGILCKKWSLPPTEEELNQRIDDLVAKVKKR
jgi:hypothetical protein